MILLFFFFMFAKLLGLIDIAAVITLFFARFLPTDVIMTVGMLLCMKGILFASTMNAISVVDAIAGIYIGLFVYGVQSHIITMFFLIFLGQKGLFSLFAR